MQLTCMYMTCILVLNKHVSQHVHDYRCILQHTDCIILIKSLNKIM